MAKKTITTIVKKADKCVIYNDDGIFCTWTDVQKFNFELIADVKSKATGLVLLISEEEAQKFFNTTYYRFGNHEAWTIAKWLIWQIYGDMETADENEERVVKFMRSCII